MEHSLEYRLNLEIEIQKRELTRYQGVIQSDYLYSNMSDAHHTLRNLIMSQANLDLCQLTLRDPLVGTIQAVRDIVQQDPNCQDLGIGRIKADASLLFLQRFATLLPNVSILQVI